MPIPTGLYVHVPFCVKKCRYCDFYSFPADVEIREQYVRILCRMLERCPFGAQTFQTIYFGGGTPSLLSPRAVSAILDTVAKHHHLIHPEITLECNPESAGRGFLAEIASMGISRVSFGLQSSHSRTLQRLGRIHSAGDVARAVDDARRAGIDNISLDVMIGLPGQTPRHLDDTLNFCLRLGVPHVSAYLLRIEPGTAFARRSMEAFCPDDDAQADLYLSAVEKLEAAGLRQYEISNFAVPGFESRHNTAYWRLSPYLGIGPSAHSLMDGARFHFPRSLHTFLSTPDPWALRVRDGLGGGLFEYLMLGLRLRSGIDLDEARSLGLDGAQFFARADPLIRSGFVRREGQSVSLTARGFLVSNVVIGELIADISQG